MSQRLPQSDVVTVSSTNNPARRGAYTDTSLTKRNVTGSLAASDQPPRKSPGNSQGDIRPVYSNDQEPEIVIAATVAAENAGVAPLPKAKNKWVMGTVDGRRTKRDPYANSGMIGQTIFRNGGS